jgi:hypothetical protein
MPFIGNESKQAQAGNLISGFVLPDHTAFVVASANIFTLMRMRS